MHVSLGSVSCCGELELRKRSWEALFRPSQAEVQVTAWTWSWHPDLEVGSLELPICHWLVRSTDNNLGLRLASEGGGLGVCGVGECWESDAISW